MNLSEEQKQAKILLNKGAKAVIVKGFGGSGKSVIVRDARDSYNNPLVVSSLGIAATNIDGLTSFSAFGIPTHYALNPKNRDAKNARRKDPYAKNFNRVNKKDCNHPYEPVKHGPIRSAGILIIDEGFFMRCDHLDFIDKTCRQALKKPLEPFGGLRVLIVGDAGQGCPIVDKDQKADLDKWEYAFPYDITQAKVWQELELHEVVLTKIFRQDNKHDGLILSRIRSGTESITDLEELNKCVGEPKLNSTTLTPWVDRAVELNEKALARSNKEEMVFVAKKKGKYKKMAEENLPAPTNLKVKPHCRVIIKKNSTKKVQGDMQRVSNGDQGVFLGMDLHNRMVIDLDRGIQVHIGKCKTHSGVKVEKELVCVDEEEDIWEERENHVIDKAHSFEQYPIKLGYAITISASQGMTINRVHLDLGSGLWDTAYGLLYTALSRVSGGFNNLTLSREITKKDNKVSPILDRVEGEQFELGLNKT